MKYALLLPVISSVAVTVNAQTALVSGILHHRDTNTAIEEIEITIPKLKLMKVTDATGKFTFSQIPYGIYQMVVHTSTISKDTVMINVDQPVVDLGVHLFAVDTRPGNMSPDQVATIALEDSFLESDEGDISGQNVSVVLAASRDPFLSAASFNFGPLRYQVRGYSRDQFEVYLNGLPMNDLATGVAFFGQWGGLNDAFRNQVVTFGLNTSEVGFGGLMGAAQIDATAADQRRQTRISYSVSNRSYRNRAMITHSSGMNEKGWAYSFAGSKRWANEGYIPGTFYDGHSFYVAVSKRLDLANSLHFTVFGAPTSRGKAMPATQEAMDIAGSNFYNPNWGYINGKKKNARVNSNFQPAVIFTYKHAPDANTQWNTSFGYLTGYNGNTALDRYNAMDPRPDHYRNLPSYFLLDPRGPNEDAAEAQRRFLQRDPDAMQVNWQRIYDANRMNSSTVNGVTGRRSVYLIGEDRDDINKFLLSSTLQKVVNGHLKMTTGVAGIYQQRESYRNAHDLLGGDYYVNLNQFAERTYIGNEEFNQNDLNDPDGIVREGDRYGYNYKSSFYRAYAWAQGEAAYNKVDLFMSGRYGVEGFRREGLFRNGLFATDSYGKSRAFHFLTYAIKAGATYKIDGRNYVYASGAVMNGAPTFDNTFVSPRTRNKTVEMVGMERVSSIEGGYLLRSPRFNGRLSGFVTEMKNTTDIKRFFHDDLRAFVNYVLQGVDVRNLGGELALRAKIGPSLSATAVAIWMQSFYTSRPAVSVLPDNDTSTRVTRTTVYMKDYYVNVGPQSAYTFGLNYSSPKYWYANINFNHFDRTYLDINPVRLTAEAVGSIQPGSDRWNDIRAQERLPAYHTIDLFGGTSLKLNKYLKGVSNDMYVYLNIGVNNLRNNRNIRTGGFEQLRFDAATRNVDRFPSKYFYGFGTNYFINVTFKF